MEFSKELTVAIKASKQAEKIAMRYFSSGVAVETKADASPVTIADREAETVIKKTIQKSFPGHGFLGEETGMTGNSDGPVWIIDPIDGTKNFIKGIPLFGILIALQREGVLEFGVSNVPGMNEFMYGQKGLGAFLNKQNVRVSNISTLEKSTVSCGGLKHFWANGKSQGLERIIKLAGRMRVFGDAYAYHLVASGRLEAVVETKIKIWDIAAPIAIIEAAGGTCTDIDGNPITEKTHTIIASNGKVHEEIVKLFQ
jgi:histidinol-phosphatase